MKLWLKLLLTGLGCFGAGFAIGHMTGKKAQQKELLKIDGITQEELDRLAANMEQALAEEKKEAPASLTSEGQPAATDIQDDEKRAYFKLWKEEDTHVEQYDTRTNESPEEAVVTEEEQEEAVEYMEKLKDIEPATIQDWVRWSNQADGEYDPVELIWYEKDNVVCSEEDNEPLEDSDKFLGFDIREQFMLVDDELSGDPDVRIVYNHKSRSIFYIRRSRVSYDKVKRMEEFEDDDDDGGEDDVAQWIKGRQ